MKLVLLLPLFVSMTTCRAFITVPSSNQLKRTATTTARTLPPPPPKATFLTAAAKGRVDDEDLLRQSKASRSASVDDRVVELVRPLGVVLNEDEKGNVYVETVAPKGNAARSGLVKEGDIVTMCSATFGDQMWSTRGVGLTRVLAAIRVRAGATVKLALESPNEGRRRAELSTKQRQAAEQARIKAQEKRDRLLTQLEKDEVKLKKGKFLGLF